MVLTTPLLTALAEKHGPVDVVVTPAAAGLLEGHPAVRDVIRYDKQGEDAGVAALWRLGAALRDRGYATAYLPHRSGDRRLLALLARVPDRDGLRGQSRRDYLYHAGEARPPPVTKSSGSSPWRDRKPGRHRPVSLGLTAEDQAAADRWLAGARDSARIHRRSHPARSGAPSGGRLPRAGRPARRPGGRGRVGGDDAALAGEIVAAAPGRAWSAAGQLTLRASAALIERARVLVTNDSAPLHLATAVGTPMVALFGPTVPEQGFGPRGSRSLALGHAGLACRPCSAHGPQVCPLGHHRCMRELPVETVAEATVMVAGAEDRRAIRPRH